VLDELRGNSFVRPRPTFRTPSRGRAAKAPRPWSCAAPPTSPGYGIGKDEPRRRVTSWPRSTRASPRGSPPPTSRRRRRCSAVSASR